MTEAMDATPGLRRTLVCALRVQRLLLLGVLLFLPLCLQIACDSRVREIRSGLSDPELLLFDRGQKLSSPCWACHDFYGTQNKVGPHLSGLYGRRAGESTFPGYSEAMRRSGIVWNDQTLRRFLSNPQGFVPGTTMVSPGFGSRADLDAVLLYLRHATSHTPRHATRSGT